ncbi:MAG: hypothetical protein JF596_22065, partial [Stenotrophomonas sp.]|nr:hypothetical protein [Stenotrophomonas sp.]
MKTWIIAACIAWMMACAGAAIAADKPVAQDGALRAEVVEAMAKLDFATLDARADALLSSRERLPDGRWKQQMLLSFLGDDMQYRCHDDACRRALMSAVEAYDRAHPGSHNAGLFHALALEREGWAARGSGYADSVSKEGWKIFRTRMEQARTVLDQRRKAMASNPAWYANRIDVSRVLDESSEQARDLLEGGIRVEPRYFQLYFNGVDREDPRWGGSVAATLRFINDYGRRAPAADEEGLYARLLWHVICCTPEVDVDPALDWAA